MTSGFIGATADPIGSARIHAWTPSFETRYRGAAIQAAQDAADLDARALLLARRRRTAGASREDYSAPPSNGGQMLGSGTVFGKSIVCPNQVFWIFAIVPSASTLRIAALMASISVLSSSRPTQEK